jgi:hypothetical protein
LVKELSSADNLYTKLLEGAMWISDEKSSVPEYRGKKFTLNVQIAMENATHQSFLLMPYGWRGTVSSAAVSPIMSKLFQESYLREAGHVALMNPTSMNEAGLENASYAVIETKNGSITATIKESNAISPGVIEISVAPIANGSASSEYLTHSQILSLCDIQLDGSWRMTNATIRKQSA